MPENQQPLIPIEQDTVLLFDRPVVAIRLPDGRIAAVFTDLCAALDLERAPQARRVRADDVIADQLLFVQIQTDDGLQPMDVLTAWAIPTWLQGIQLSRLAPEKRPAIRSFKREAADVLYRHFAQRQLALPPAGVIVPAVPEAVSVAAQVAQIAEQIETLTGVVGFLQEHLAGLLALPQQVAGFGEQLGQALTMLESLAERQDAADTQLARIDERTQRLTPAHARTVQELVDRLVRETRQLPVPLSYAIVYGRLKHRFRANSYREIADERYEEVMAYLGDELRRAREGEAPEQGSLF